MPQIVTRPSTDTPSKLVLYLQKVATESYYRGGSVDNQQVKHISPTQLGISKPSFSFIEEISVKNLVVLSDPQDQKET